MAMAEARRRHASTSRLCHLTPTEAQRHRLRPQSIDVGRKLHYNEIDNPQPLAPLTAGPTQRARVSFIPNSRATALLA